MQTLVICPHHSVPWFSLQQDGVTVGHSSGSQALQTDLIHFSPLANLEPTKENHSSCSYYLIISLQKTEFFLYVMGHNIINICGVPHSVISDYQNLLCVDSYVLFTYPSLLEYALSHGSFKVSQDNLVFSLSLW